MMYWDPESHEMVCDEQETPYKLKPQQASVSQGVNIDPLALYAAAKIASYSQAVEPVVTPADRVGAWMFFLSEFTYAVAVLAIFICFFVVPTLSHIPSFLVFVVAPLVSTAVIYYYQNKDYSQASTRKDDPNVGGGDM